MLECLRQSVRQADVPFHVSEVKMVDNQKWWHSQITCFHTSNRQVKVGTLACDILTHSFSLTLKLNTQHREQHRLSSQKSVEEESRR